MTLTLAWLVVVAGLVLAAIGVVVPVLPGVPLAFLATLLAAWMTDFTRIDLNTVLWVGLLAVVAQALDVLGNVVGAKRFGASTAGLWGGAVGALVGLVLLPPWGFLIGAFAGAMLLEVIKGRALADAARAGTGAMLGALAGVGGKLVVVLVIAWVVVGRLLSG